ADDKLAARRQRRARAGGCSRLLGESLACREGHGAERSRLKHRAPAHPRHRQPPLLWRAPVGPCARPCYWRGGSVVRPAAACPATNGLSARAAVTYWRGAADRDHHSASGPSRLLAPSTANAASQAAGLAGPPAASSATPTAHAPTAERPKPTV